MTPRQMRIALVSNPGWNALDALEGCFGMPPMARHITQANNGGLNDRRTIFSIPNQVVAIRSIFSARFPGIILSNAQLFGSILLQAFDQRRMIDRTLSNVINGQSINRGVQEWLDEVDFVVPHSAVTLYREVLGREPDAEGLAFWVRQIDGGFPVPKARAAFEASYEARKR